MNYETIQFEQQDGIATVTLNRPQALNALNTQLLKELEHVFQAMRERAVPRAVILTGAGKAFAAGADISEFPTMTAEKAERVARRGQSLFDAIAAFAAPVIAAVNGFALGGGCEMAMACDFIYASERAKFGQPEVKLGLIPGYGGTQRLARLVGTARAKELIYTGRIIDAQEAFRIGLANAVVPPDELLTRVRAVAQEIAAQSPVAVRSAKAVLQETDARALEAGLENEVLQFGRCFGTPDMKEGVGAFLEKRVPQFKD